MAIVIDSSGKPGYMFQAGATSTDGIWYQISGKTDTAAGYEWGGTHTFLNTVTTDADVILRDGFNNFLNPAARDAAITSPVRGTICFVRQDAGGNSINQIQYYSGSAWTANDGDISQVSAGTGLSGGGTAGNVTLSVDTAVVATTNNTLTMSGKTLTTPTINGATISGSFTSTATISGGTLSSPTVSGLYLSDSSIVFEGSGGDDANETTLTVTNPTADRTITLPNVDGTVITTGNLSSITSTGTLTSLTVSGDITLSGTNGMGSIQDEFTLLLMGAL